MTGIFASISGVHYASINNKVHAEYPTYSLSDVEKHNSYDTQLWVTFGDGVYNLTNFNNHIGGKKYIELIAGGRLEPFWSIFSDHLKHKEILDMLEKYRIGNLVANDQLDIQDIQDMFDNINEFTDYSNEPFEDRPLDQLIIMRTYPFIAEPMNELAADSFLTPNKLFYVRNHFPVPHELNEQNYKLDLHLNVNCDIKFNQMIDNFDDIKCDKSLSLNELKNEFENVEIISTLQCCGNRGYSTIDANNFRGKKFSFPQNGLISTAKWKGVRIRDVLLANGYNENDSKFDKYKFVTFYGYDTDLSTMHYAISVPIQHVMNKANDCLLAFEMNDMILPRDHGYPIRALLPGVAGCRSVKWLAKIQLTEHEVDSKWQNKSYQPWKYQIYDMPVMSIISRPKNGDKLSDIITDDKYIEIKGIAWSGGGRGIIRVEISLDDGETWHLCDLQQEESQQRGKQWAWTIWKYKYHLSQDNMNPDKQLKIMCRAMDSSFNSQPDDVKHIANGTQYLNNSWHRIMIE